MSDRVIDMTRADLEKLFRGATSGGVVIAPAILKALPPLSIAYVARAFGHDQKWVRRRIQKGVLKKDGDSKITAESFFNLISKAA